VVSDQGSDIWTEKNHGSIYVKSLESVICGIFMCIESDQKYKKQRTFPQNIGFALVISLLFGCQITNAYSNIRITGLRVEVKGICGVIIYLIQMVRVLQ
jgi:hypothetical protein